MLIFKVLIVGSHSPGFFVELESEPQIGSKLALRFEKGGSFALYKVMGIAAFCEFTQPNTVPNILRESVIRTITLQSVRGQTIE